MSGIRTPFQCPNVKKLKQLYQEGWSLELIARDLYSSTKTVRRWLEEAGIERKPVKIRKKTYSSFGK